MQIWKIEIAGDGGIVSHEIPPLFSAKWTTGDDPGEISALEGPCWSDEGSEGGEDAVYIHSIQWAGKPPKQAEFESLMREAAREIDRFISSGL